MHWSSQKCATHCAITPTKNERLIKHFMDSNFDIAYSRSTKRGLCLHLKKLNQCITLYLTSKKRRSGAEFCITYEAKITATEKFTCLSKLVEN